MQSQNVGTATLECFRQQHVVDLHAPDHRFAVEPVVVDASQRYRVELVEADRVGARLIFGPGDRGLIDDAGNSGTDRLRARVQREFRYGRADGEHANSGAAAGKTGVPGERANDHVKDEHRAEAVADEDDLVQSPLVRPRQQGLRKAI